MKQPPASAAKLAIATPAAIAQEMMAQAALVHRFDPLELLPPALESETVASVLAIVAQDATEVEWRGPSGGDPPQIRWRLEPRARRRELSRLAADGKIATLRPDPPDGDPFARYLQLALKGQLRPGEIPAGERDSAVAAVTFAAEALGEQGVETADQTKSELRTLVSEAAEDTRSRAVLRGNLIGRADESAAIDAFVASGAVPKQDLLPQPAKLEVDAPGYLLTGVVGCGKSALAASLVRRRRGVATLPSSWVSAPVNRLISAVAHLWGGALVGGHVVLLDFERTTITLGGPLEWTTEVMRQLAFGHPPLARKLSDMRTQVRSAQATLGSLSVTRGTATLAATADMKDGLARVLGAEQRTDTSLLLLLDTFEEVASRSFPPPEGELRATLFGRVLDWADSLSALQGESGPVFSAIRVVALGREAPPLSPSELGGWFKGHHVIGPLDPASAVEFLRSRDERQRFDRARARRAVDVVGGHPLTLLLLAHYAQNQSLEEIDRTIGDRKIGLIMGGEEAAQALYARFLLRHHDAPEEDASALERLRRMAVLGLVLREITPELLHEVIAPACGIDDLVPEQVRALYDRLAGQFWLVARVAEQNAVRHKPEARRLMLPMVLGDTDEHRPAGGDARPPAGTGQDSIRHVRTQALAVHQGAVQYYTTRARQATAPEAAHSARLEADYHKAFVTDPPFAASLAEPSSDAFALRCRQLAASAGDDVFVMPLIARALLRFHSVGPVRMTAAELAALDPTLRAQADLARMSAELLQGRTGRRLGMVGSLRSRVFGLWSRGRSNDPLNLAAAPGSAALSQAADDEQVGADLGPAPTSLAARSPPAPSMSARHSALRSPDQLFNLMRDPELGTRVAHAFTVGDFGAAAVLGFEQLTSIHVLPDLSAPWHLAYDPVMHWTWQSALGQLASGGSAAEPMASILEQSLRSIGERTDADRAKQDSLGIALATVTTIALGRRPSDQTTASIKHLANIVSQAPSVRNHMDLRILALQTMWTRESAQAISIPISIPTSQLQVFSKLFIPHESTSDVASLAVGEFRTPTASGRFKAIVSSARKGKASSQDLDSFVATSEPWILNARAASSRGLMAQVLAGTTPELYDSAIGALIELDVVDSKAVDEAIEYMRAHAAVWPPNLTPKEVPARDRDRRAGLVARAVVHADRCNVLTLMLSTAATAAGGHKRLEVVADLSHRYRAVLLGV